MTSENDYLELKKENALLKLELSHYKSTVRSLHYCLNSITGMIRESQQKNVDEFIANDELSIAT